jgi:hypothetical protein
VWAAQPTCTGPPVATCARVRWKRRPTVIYLATASGPRVRAAIASGQLGQLITPNAGNRLVPGARWWAIDNGCPYVTYAPDANLPRLLRFLRQATQPTLFDEFSY